MKSKTNSVIRLAGLIVFGAALLAAAGKTAYAQGGYYDPYNNAQNNPNYDGHRREDRQEKRALKYHQRQERDYNGNDSSTRAHQRAEKRSLKQHGRYEDGGYYGNSSYNSGFYGNRAPYGNGGNYGNRYPNGPYRGGNRNNGHNDSGSVRNRIGHVLGRH